MAIEPVNERPIFPSLTRLDAVGVGHWSVSMIRQLTTVFQQYGYKLNQTLLDEDLAAEGGSIPEVDRTNTWVPAQVFQTAPTATGHPLRWDELAANGGTIPETDRSNTFTEDQHTDGAGFVAENGGGNWFNAIVTDDSDSDIFRGRDSGNNIIGRIIARDLDGAGAGHLELAGLWAFANMPSVGADALIETGSNANGSWISFAGLFAVAWRVVTPDWTTGSFQDWAMPITFSMEPMMFVTMFTHTGGGPGNAAINVLQGCTTSASGGNSTFRIAFRDGTDANAAGEQITITAMGVL